MLKFLFPIFKNGKNLKIEFQIFFILLLVECFSLIIPTDYYIRLVFSI